jgi:hypothetical protein
VEWLANVPINFETCVNFFMRKQIELLSSTRQTQYIISDCRQYILYQRCEHAECRLYIEHLVLAMAVIITKILTGVPSNRY